VSTQEPEPGDEVVLRTGGPVMTVLGQPTIGLGNCFACGLMNRGAGAGDLPRGIAQARQTRNVSLADLSSSRRIPATIMKKGARRGTKQPRAFALAPGGESGACARRPWPFERGQNGHSKRTADWGSARASARASAPGIMRPKAAYARANRRLRSPIATSLNGTNSCPGTAMEVEHRRAT
jgi:hypothetical protein